MAQLSSRLRQAGISLVELMIALALGLMLVAGLYTMLSSNQQTYSAVRTNTQLSDSERRIELVMDKMLNQAGFRNYARVRDKEKLPAATVSGANGTTLNWVVGQAITGVNNSSGVSGVKDGTDTLTIRFYGSSRTDMDPSLSAAADLTTADDTIFDCSGTSRSRNNLVIMTFFVDESNNLKCYDNLSQTATIMETGVENMQFRFRTSGETAQFIVAPAANSSDWNNIQIIEYAMLVAKAYQQGMTNQVRTFQLLDTTVTSSADGKMRQIIRGSNMLRNQDKS